MNVKELKQVLEGLSDDSELVFTVSCDRGGYEVTASTETNGVVFGSEAESEE